MTTSVFEEFILDIEKMVVFIHKEKVLLLINNFSNYLVSNIDAQLIVTRFEFLPQNTISRFQTINAKIIQLFNVQYII